jgi:hypothetical protein
LAQISEGRDQRAQKARPTSGDNLLAARGERKVASTTWAVCILDTAAALRDSALGLFTTPATIRAAKARARRRGVVTGPQMARIFAWMRANDLLWNYWVNNYLLGHKPPAVDILYWNNDTTACPGSCTAICSSSSRPTPSPTPVAGDPTSRFARPPARTFSSHRTRRRRSANRKNARKYPNSSERCSIPARVRISSPDLSRRASVSR